MEIMMLMTRMIIIQVRNGKTLMGYSFLALIIEFSCGKI